MHPRLDAAHVLIECGDAQRVEAGGEVFGIPFGQQPVAHLGLVRAADKAPADGVVTDAVQYLVVAKVGHLDGAKDLHDAVDLASFGGLGDRDLGPVGRIGAKFKRR